VDCSKAAELIPGFELAWNVELGAEQLAAAISEQLVDHEQFFGSLIRLEHIKRMKDQGRLDGDLRVIEMR
jgi:hypothetical protein